ncbi:MAG: hypothetical protein U5R06_02155 [candidate division KSB1 bacterium]|nr:hypothetical protein [candidate division KSB1 bacterium]
MKMYYYDSTERKEIFKCLDVIELMPKANIDRNDILFLHWNDFVVINKIFMNLIVSSPCHLIFYSGDSPDTFQERFKKAIEEPNGRIKEDLINHQKDDVFYLPIIFPREDDGIKKNLQKFIEKCKEKFIDPEKYFTMGKFSEEYLVDILSKLVILSHVPVVNHENIYLKLKSKKLEIKGLLKSQSWEKIFKNADKEELFDALNNLDEENIDLDNLPNPINEFVQEWSSIIEKHVEK